MSIRAEPFWDRDAVRRMTTAFGLILVYQAIPMVSSLLEQTMIRTVLPSVESAGYYMVSRFADFSHYLTFPLLLVMFPYTATAARKGVSTCPYVVKCSAVTLAVSMMMAIAYAFFGEELLSLMPNGENYITYVKYMPWLVLINALTTCQVFYANAEVSAGRFGFLWWFVPLHLIYMGVLTFGLQLYGPISLTVLIVCFGVVSVLRFLFSGIACQAEDLDSSRVSCLEKKIDF
jgi:hypothetical protein